MEHQPTSPTRRLPRRPHRAERPLAQRAELGVARSLTGDARQDPLARWLLAGRYRMDEVIGRGGMSTVYRGTDTVLDRVVAVKVLLTALAQSDPTHIRRFRREARAVAALHDPAVVKIYDTGVDEDCHFLVMEHVDGRSLDEVLRERRTLAPAGAVNIAARVSDALAAAHAAGILHRDVKPANVMLTDDGQVKVLDFGIARPLEEATLTQTASAIGTASYMAPERVRGEPGDERSDIYALGCLLYAMLAGGPPFVANEQVAVLHQQVHAEPPPLRALGARISPGLELLTLRMLAKDPAARPQTAAEVAVRLRELGGAAAVRPLISPGPFAPARRPLMPLILMGALVALVLLVAALTSGQGGRAARLQPRHATGSYHEAVIHTTSPPVMSATPAAPAAPATVQPAAHGKGPDGAGPPGHAAKPGGGPGHGGKAGKGDGGD